MKILIQKFGGTSVSTEDRRNMVINKVLSAKNKGYAVVVVVSAMGRKGDSYSTDTLLSLISEDFIKTNKQACDLLMSCGEIISTVVVSDCLQKKGLKSIPLTGGQAGIITDDEFTNASILNVNKEKLLNFLSQNYVPVVAGFQGSTKDGYMTTLGRGGSDVTASLLGAALAAEEVEIYTDVDGIMTADPRIVSDASLIKQISYNEVFQFADQGAKVIHPRAVEIAMKHNVPLVIKNTMTTCEGTVINNNGSMDSSSLITGITHMAKRVQVRIAFSKNEDNSNYQNILELLAQNSISIDLINVFPDDNIFTIDEEDLSKFKNLMKDCELEYSYIENCSKISIIGSRIRGIPGVMARILRVLKNENIEVLQTADSHTTIWCLVNNFNIDKAIKSLHKEFNL